MLTYVPGMRGGVGFNIFQIQCLVSKCHPLSNKIGRRKSLHNFSLPPSPFLPPSPPTLSPSHASTVEDPDCLHGLLEQTLQSPFTQGVLGALEILIIIVPPTEILLPVRGELLDDDVDILTQGVVVVKALSNLPHPLYVCVCISRMYVCVCWEEGVEEKKI